MIEEANKQKKKLRVALFGNSGHGKSFSALQMGLSLGSGKVLVIDAEDGAIHNFSDIAKFSVIQLKDVSIAAYLEAINEAAKHADKFDCVVVDGLSQAWQFALQEVAKERNTQLGWGKVSPQWDALFHALKRIKTHLIVTFRSKTRQDNGKWTETWDSRDNSDYDFDLILKMTGVVKENNNTVAKAEIVKCRFNTDNQKVRKGGVVSVGSSLAKYLSDWQSKTQQQATQEGETK